MISYREADLFNTLQSQNTPVELKAYVSEFNGNYKHSFSVRFRDIHCSNKEVKSKFKTILYPILEEYKYKKLGTEIMNEDFETMSGAEANFTGIIMDLKNDARIKSVTNKMEWIPGSRNKVMNMEVFIRG